MNELDDPTREPPTQHLSSWARYKLHLAAHPREETSGATSAQADSSHPVAATALGHCRCQCDDHDDDAHDDPHFADRPG